MIKLEGADVICWNVSCGQGFGYLSHDAALVCRSKLERCQILVSDNCDKCTLLMLFYTSYCCLFFFPQSNNNDDKHNKCSPNPSGCPPMRTIFHSSPEALVKSTLFGNLQRKDWTMRFQDSDVFRQSACVNERKRLRCFLSSEISFSFHPSFNSHFALHSG